MKIVIANGKNEADYVIQMFKKEGHQLIIINSCLDTCQYLSLNHKMEIYHGDATKISDLENARIQDADLFISLSMNDVENYISCTMAKKFFAVQRTIAVVINPKNVNLFKLLGIDSVINSTYLLTESIKNESEVEKLIKTLALEEEKILITEIEINADFRIVGKAIADLKFPKFANISCIYRYPHVIIPNGATIIEAQDKLVIISSAFHQTAIVDFIRRRD